MVRASICDDDVIVAQKLKLIIEKEFLSRNIDFMCDIYVDGIKFLENNIESQDELIILDIEMPALNGIEIAEYLKKAGRNKNIVFVTNHENLVFRSLQFYPFSFIRKKDIDEEFPEMLKQFILEISKKNASFMFETKKTMVSVRTDTIMYLTYWEHKILLVTDKDDRYEFRSTLKECLKQLSEENFFRVNSGAIVNLKYVKKLEDSCIIMESGYSIQLSRDRKKEFKERFMKFWRKI